jgi:hypothetical protein
MDIIAARLDCRPAIASLADVMKPPDFSRLLHDPLIGTIPPS